MWRHGCSRRLAIVAATQRAELLGLANEVGAIGPGMSGTS
jgi:hypothetical protein